MAAKSTSSRWRSRWAFLLAATGSSIGLGNLWKFPYEVGLHGGGTFVVVYIVAVLLVGLPLMLCEVVIGRSAGSEPVSGIKRIIAKEHLSSLWQIIAWLSMFCGLLVFSFYAVVASWILSYAMQALSGQFHNIPAEIAQHTFGAMTQNTGQLLLWHAVFVVFAVLILSRGVSRGLERALMLLMPVFFILLVWVIVSVVQVGDVNRAFIYLTQFQWQNIHPELIVSAVTQAMFSLSIGLGALLVYGAYVRDDQPLGITASIIVVFDTLIALLIGLMVFSIVFAFDLPPDSGKALLFETVPVALTQLGEASIYLGGAFFILLAIAALTSAFALLEPMISWAVTQFAVSRRLASWLAGVLGWLLSLPVLYSLAGEQFTFYYFDKEYVHGVFDGLNLLATHVFIPITALLIAVFAGWRMSRKRTQVALAFSINGYRLWRFSSKTIVPLVILALMIMVFA